MKMNSGLSAILITAWIIFVHAFTIHAQDTTMWASKIQAGYFKDSYGQESIVAKLLVKKERYEPYPNAAIRIYSVTDTVNIPLTTGTTDDNGEVKYILEDKDKGYADSTGQLSFLVVYEGSPTIEADEMDLQVHPASLKVAFFQEDTTKFISVQAFEHTPADSSVPIPDLEVVLSIKGTFSYLEIAKEVTDQDGRLVVPFPVHMPGDTLGVLTIAAKIEDHDRYGNVEAWGNINWARPVPLAMEPKRGLGDTDAPLWMVYTLIVLLSAVWFHYAYVIFLVIKIKLSKHEA